MAFREALAWWHAMLAERLTVPLAPRAHFPRVGEPGVAYLFTDAAREGGTGYGAHSVVVANGRPFFIFHERRWRPDALAALQADRLSMPAGECHGAVVFADALVRALGGVTHLVCFTDSDATAKGFTTAASGSPQLNVQLLWLLRRHPRLQLLGVHQPGVRNGAADDLSRTAEGRARVLAAALAAGLDPIEIFPDAREADALLDLALDAPLRASA